MSEIKKLKHHLRAYKRSRVLLKTEIVSLKRKLTALTQKRCECGDHWFKPCVVCYRPVCDNCITKPDSWYNTDSPYHEPDEQECTKCKQEMCRKCRRYCQLCYDEAEAPPIECATCTTTIKTKTFKCNCKRMLCPRHWDDEYAHGKWCSSDSLGDSDAESS